MSDDQVMDAKTARTLNIRALVSESGGPTEFSERYGEGKWSQAQVSSWISDRAPKSIGHALARAIERDVGMATGAMDRPPLGSDQSAPQPQSLDLHMLGAALTWLDFDEEVGGKYKPTERASRLLEVYAQLQATGGSLTPRQSDTFISSAKARRQVKRRNDER